MSSIRRCISRRSAFVNTNQLLYWSVQDGTEDDRAQRGNAGRGSASDPDGDGYGAQPRGVMTEEIESPVSFPRAGDVTGKRVVLTGAGRGLGQLLAHAFSRAGALVALVARTEKDLKAVAEVLPGPSLVLSGDVTDED